MYSKFFDNKGAAAAPPAPDGRSTPRWSAWSPSPKPTTSRRQLNNYGADFPYTFFGLEPGTTKEQVRHCLEIWNQGDNHITDLSKAYRLEPGTGWYVPAGVLHAPGSLCTYEPQWASDVFAMFQSLVNEVPIGWELLVKNVPPENAARPGLHRLDGRLGCQHQPELQGDHFRPPCR